MSVDRRLDPALERSRKLTCPTTPGSITRVKIFQRCTDEASNNLGVSRGERTRQYSCHLEAKKKIRSVRKRQQPANHRQLSGAISSNIVSSIKQLRRRFSAVP
jgi:hypothetical protein